MNYIEKLNEMNKTIVNIAIFKKTIVNVLPARSTSHVVAGLLLPTNGRGIIPGILLNLAPTSEKPVTIIIINTIDCLLAK